ncbi:heat-shock protein [Methanococcoides sp. FTZ1]|uniref:heat-shock protein n=1 Tax=Methanococcoides sp. FTZ1 TaxID=3439061 RepID=UPI003F83F2F2
MNAEFSDNPFLQALAVSGTMSIFMIGMAIGVMNIISTRISPMPSYMILLIFAVIFIVGSVFFEKRGADQIGALIGGCVVSLASTISIFSFFGGVDFVLNGGLTELGPDRLISALAICMIASMLLVKLLSYKMQAEYA